MSVAEWKQSGIEPLCLTIRNFVKAQFEVVDFADGQWVHEVPRQYSSFMCQGARSGGHVRVCNRKQLEIPLETGGVRAKVI
jgi:hypothetical protein